MSNNVSCLIVNTSDLGGGAEKIAMDLHQAYLARNLESVFLVGNKRSVLPSVVEIPPTNWFKFWHRLDRKLINTHFRGANRLHEIVNNIKAPFYQHSQKKGLENYHYPQSRRMVNRYQESVDVIHLHNLHDEYFDLRMLPDISLRHPVVITMHDEYLFTGHCACTLGCERWRSGCGECPHLDVYPAVRIDNTNRNWKKKNIIFSKSDLTLVTPSSWLAQRTRSSFLGHLPVRVIPNGVDLAVFKPGSQTAARNLLNIDPNAFMILFTAAGGRGSAFKDYAMLDRVTKRLQKHKFRQQVILLALGGNKDQHTIVNQVTMIEKPFIKEQGEVAKHYQACDLYIHTAKADNAPLVILEAMACGKPIVSTSAGGIPELVREGETGYTIPMGDDLAMFDRIISLMGNQNRLNQMGAKASKIAQSEYGLEQMVSNYLTLYQELIDARSI